jgi:hypothetical protein
MLFPDEEKKVNSQIKANAYLLNPFLKKDGSLANKYIDYQAVIDNPNINNKVRQFITEATGLTAKAQPAVSSSASGNGGTGATVPAVSIPQSAGAEAGNGSFGGKLGAVSAKYEAGGWNPGAVSSGKGDYGGVSYGMPQFSTTTGSAKSFVNWLKKSNPDMGNAFGNYSPGTAEFGDAWKNVASRYGDAFGNIQNQYVYDNMVMPFVQRAKEKTGVDLNATPALRELAFSTAIQFGGAGTYALGNINPDMSEKDIINAVYNNKINNIDTYFRSSGKDVRNGVRNRFVNERNDLLALTN